MTGEEAVDLRFRSPLLCLLHLLERCGDLPLSGAEVPEQGGIVVRNGIRCIQALSEEKGFESVEILFLGLRQVPDIFATTECTSPGGNWPSDSQEMDSRRTKRVMDSK